MSFIKDISKHKDDIENAELAKDAFSMSNDTSDATISFAKILVEGASPQDFIKTSKKISDIIENFQEFIMAGINTSDGSSREELIQKLKEKIAEIEEVDSARLEKLKEEVEEIYEKAIEKAKLMEAELVKINSDTGKFDMG